MNSVNFCKEEKKFYLKVYNFGKIFGTKAQSLQSLVLRHKKYEFLTPRRLYYFVSVSRRQKDATVTVD